MTPKRKPQPRYRRLSTIVATPVQWLIAGYVALGNVTLVAGDPGVGKSMLAYDLAAKVTTGQPLPGGPPGLPRDVLVIHPEDHTAVVQQRIEAAHGDPDRIHLVDQAGPRLPRPLDLSRDLARLRALIGDGDYGLVVIENLGLLLGEASNTEARTRVAMHGLHQIAEQTDTALVAILHLTKAQHRQALHAGAGRVAQAGTARSVTIVAPDPDDPNLRVWASAKNNLGPTPPSLRYEITNAPLGPKVNWLGTTQWAADGLLRTTTSDRAPKLAEAEQMLRDILANGPRLRSDIKTAAAHRAIGWRTVEDAKTNLAIRSIQVPEPGVRGPGPSWWTLPETDDRRTA